MTVHPDEKNGLRHARLHKNCNEISPCLMQRRIQILIFWFKWWVIYIWRFFLFRVLKSALYNLSHSPVVVTVYRGREGSTTVSIWRISVMVWSWNLYYAYTNPFSSKNAQCPHYHFQSFPNSCSSTLKRLKPLTHLWNIRRFDLHHIGLLFRLFETSRQNVEEKHSFFFNGLTMMWHCCCD